MKYLSSKGAVEISTMTYSYAANALAKLRREAPERKEEIAALADHIETLDAEKQSDNPRVSPGDNNPPEEKKAVDWDGLKTEIDERLDDVRGITGVKIDNQAQADQAGQLLRDLRALAKQADQLRTDEKAPLDLEIKKIQDRYNEYIAPLKNKQPGLISKAELALKNQIAAWLKKLGDDKRQRGDEARAKAQALEEEARAAHQAAQKSDDLDQIEEAESLLAAADTAALELRQVEKSKVQARGDYRAIGLRSVWRAERIEGEGGKALIHYAKTQPERVIAFIEMLAAEDVKAGIRSISGFTIIEDKVAA